MNHDQIQGSFRAIKGKIKEAWGRLTDNDLALYEGRKDEFFGRVQEKYGLTKEEAKRRTDEIERNSTCC